MRVHPAHGAGSPCGADIADRLVTTIGYERAHNKALQITDEAKFVEFTLSTAPPAPVYPIVARKMRAIAISPYFSRLKHMFWFLGNLHSQ